MSDTGVMAGVRDTDDNPIGRDGYAIHLEKVLNGPAARVGVVEVRAADLNVAAELLDELAALHPGEHLGLLARDIAVRFYDRLGI